LFGSYTYGEPHKDSDFDMLIIKDTDEVKNKRASEIRKHLRGIIIPINIVVKTCVTASSGARKEQLSSIVIAWHGLFLLYGSITFRRWLMDTTVFKTIT